MFCGHTEGPIKILFLAQIGNTILRKSMSNYNLPNTKCNTKASALYSSSTNFVRILFSFALCLQGHANMHFISIYVSLICFPIVLSSLELQVAAHNFFSNFQGLLTKSYLSFHCFKFTNSFYIFFSDKFG